MGSRAVAVIARDIHVARDRFGIGDGSTGAIYTRTGRPFFPDTAELVDRVRAAIGPLFARLDTDWIALDCELLPWSAKAIDLITAQYGAVGAASREALPATLAVLEQAAGRGLPVADLTARMTQRHANAVAFREVYGSYVRPTDGIEGITLAPFKVLAVEGRAPAVTEPHEWHLRQLGTLTDELITPTRHRFVDLSSQRERADATRWWQDLTAAGGEGMVVKPAHQVASDVLPGLKVRGREYLRMVYGPDYTDSLELLRDRRLGRKRGLARREHGLGLDALESFVERKPLWTVHQLAFAVLALESEPVDPRL